MCKTIAYKSQPPYCLYSGGHIWLHLTTSCPQVLHSGTSPSFNHFSVHEFSNPTNLLTGKLRTEKWYTTCPICAGDYDSNLVREVIAQGGQIHIPPGSRTRLPGILESTPGFAVGNVLVRSNRAINDNRIGSDRYAANMNTLSNMTQGGYQNGYRTITQVNGNVMIIPPNVRRGIEVDRVVCAQEVHGNRTRRVRINETATTLREDVVSANGSGNRNESGSGSACCVM